MRIRSKAIVGRVGDNGEVTANWEALREFLSMHKGKVAIIRAELQPREASERTKNYFFGYIIPELRNAFLENGDHLTKEQTYDALRRLCPLFVTEERKGGEWRKHLREWEELDQAEVNEIIDWTIQFAAENLYRILDPPITER